MNSEYIIGKTESVCPVCLKKIPAEKVKVGNDVYMQKTCGEHGSFKTIIWRGEPDFTSWYQVKKAEHPDVCLTQVDKGCPFDCGLCPEHRRRSCCVLLEVTQRCNLQCPVCFADAGTEGQQDPSLADLQVQLQTLWESAGNCNIQLSGGEPTLREDLPEIIAAARAIGYTFFQLNTNGLRLSEDLNYVKALKEAGLSTVFLQFDGTRDEIYQRIRGCSLFQAKTRAIENCARHNIGVVLVPTLIPGINADSVGEIIRYALQGLPAIRGVHFQPVSYFGRYPVPPADRDRITLPEVMAAIEAQTGGLMKIGDFAPSGCENNLCSFHGDFLLNSDGSVTPLSEKQDTCCNGREKTAEDTVLKSQDFLRKRWAMREDTKKCCDHSGSEYQEWDKLLDQLKNQRISISCMAFQDAENLDLERLKDCYVHVVSKGRIIPFCAYNLSSRLGLPLYREK